MSYIGKSPTGTGVRSRYYYTATGGETSISGADDSGATLTFTDGAYVDVYLNGVLLVAGTDYNTSTANTIGGLAALAGSDIVEVLVYDTFTVADAVKASSGGTFNGAVTVNGTVTASGLTVDGGTVAGAFAIISNTEGTAKFGTDSNYARILDGSNNILLAQSNAESYYYNNGVKVLKTASGGDISFYDSTGVTQGFFWDASTQRLGLGTTSPTSLLHLSASDPRIRITDTDTAGTFELRNTSNVAYISNLANAPMLFSTNSTEQMRIDSSGNVGIGTSSPATPLDVTKAGGGNFVATFQNTTSATPYGVHIKDAASGANGYPLLQVTDNAGTGIRFRVDSGTGNVRVSQNIYSANGTGVYFVATSMSPTDGSGTRIDNARNVGSSVYRWDDIYATNGTIVTSDANEKQQIASLTDAEITAAKAISKLFKTFKWNDSVAEKGDAARTHTGHIAQEVVQAMTDAGLDAGNYAFFISSTWWEHSVDVPAVAEQTDDEGNVIVEAQDAYTRIDTYESADEAPEGATERTRLGLRYPELLAFIGAATEQRLSNIESRLSALETAQ